MRPRSCFAARGLLRALPFLLAPLLVAGALPAAPGGGSPGTVVAWGANASGQATVPPGLTGVTRIAAGAFHGLALQADGTVVAWGNNTSGQATVPPGLAGVTRIAAGVYHSLALQADGTVVAWGNNASGQATVPPGLTRVTQIAGGGFYSLALQADGTVVAWGDNASGQATVPPGLTRVTQIAAGYLHILALQADGTVVGWGYNTFGQLNVPPGLAGVTQIAAGGHHSLALRADGTVVAWGYNGEGQATVPPGLADVTQIAAGGNHSLALRADGTVVAWGDNTEGQLNVPPGLTGVTRIAAGQHHSLALQADGTVGGLGHNGAGQLNVPPSLAGVTRVAAGGSHSLALQADGTVLGWGDNAFGQATVPSDLAGVTQIAAGLYHSLALQADGTVVAWGGLGHGESAVPPGLAGVGQIAAGYICSLALKADGTVVAWGDNAFGQLNVPPGLAGVIQIASGWNHSLALRADGTVVAWGDNRYGQASVPSGLTRVTQVAAAASHSVALNGDGTVVGWGENLYGQTDVPPGLTGVTQIAAAGGHNMALRANGTVVGWGQNLYGQTNVPPGLTGVTHVAAGDSISLFLRFLAAPTRLAAFYAHPFQARVTWYDASDSETAFQVQRSTDPNFATVQLDYTLNTPNAPGSGSPVLFVDRSLLGASTRYYYRVRARDALGGSAWVSTSLRVPDATGAMQFGSGGAFSAGETAVRATLTVTRSGNTSGDARVHYQTSDGSATSPGDYAAVSGDLVFSAGETSKTVPVSVIADALLEGPETFTVTLSSPASGSTLGAPTTATVTIQDDPARPAPAGLAARFLFPGRVALQWRDRCANEDGFQLQRSTEPGFAAAATQTFSVGADEQAYTDDVAGGTHYYYRVRAVRTVNAAAVASSYSNTADLTTPGALGGPGVPTGLTATAVSGTAVDLAWTETSAGFTGFVIDRKPGAPGDPGTYIRIARLSAVAVRTSYVYRDSGLTPGQLYTWQVRASGLGDYSAPATTSATPPTAPGTPVLTATPQPAGVVQLSWTAPFGSVSSYQLFRKDAPLAGAGSFRLLLNLPAGTQQFTDRNLVQHATYTYKVQATGTGGTSPADTQEVLTLSAAATPGGVSAQARSSSAIGVTWTYAGGDNPQFEVQRKPGAAGDPGTFTRVALLPGTAREFVDGGLAAGTTYTYRVGAFSGNGTAEPLSATSIATTNP